MNEPDFITEGVFRPDVLATDGGKPSLVGSKCSNCGDIRFPRVVGCPGCHADESALRPVLLGRQGTDVTACRIDRSGPYFEVPYLVRCVQLPERVRVLCQIEAKTMIPADLIGKSAELVLGQLLKKDGSP